MKNLVSRFVKDESGATAIEYGLIAAGISIAIVTAVGTVGSQLNTNFETIKTKLKPAAVRLRQRLRQGPRSYPGPLLLPTRQLRPPCRRSCSNGLLRSRRFQILHQSRLGCGDAPIREPLPLRAALS